jgi:hypothetical protein
MRNLSFIILLFLLPIFAIGQTHFEEVSKPLTSKNELKGNSILLNSPKINAAKNSGMAFLGFDVKNISNENIVDLKYFMINGNLSTKTELSKKLVD